MKTKRHYTARWLNVNSGNQLGNVSFDAKSASEAIRKADRIGAEIGLPKSPRTIHQGETLVHTKGYLG